MASFHLTHGFNYPSLKSLTFIHDQIHLTLPIKINKSPPFFYRNELFRHRKGLNHHVNDRAGNVKPTKNNYNDVLEMKENKKLL
jgi:hypothetical protein